MYNLVSSVNILGVISEFRDVVFEDVVFDNNRVHLILYLDWGHITIIIKHRILKHHILELHNDV